MDHICYVTDFAHLLRRQNQRHVRKKVIWTLHAQKKCEKVQTKKEENILDLGEPGQEYLEVTGGKSGSCFKAKN